MVDVFLQTLPFFLLICVGYGAGVTGFFNEDATAALTRFMFYFALSAMIFRFAANISFADVFDPTFILVYFCATGLVYVVATGIALIRRLPLAEGAIEAQCAVIGNIGFLGIPMLALIMGEAAVGYIMMMLAVDLLFFGTLVVVLITGSRGSEGRKVIPIVAKGIVSNPMLLSIFLGFSWSAMGWSLAKPLNDFLFFLGAAATPGALFTIGASLASRSTERLAVAGYLTCMKLCVHPAIIALAVLVIWPIEPYAAAVMIASSALPVAGNIFMIASHYAVAPQRVSTSILVSTVTSILTVSLVLAWLAETVSFQ